MTEDYTSFEIAKLLKEKGFDEPCNTVYRKTLKDNKFIDEPDFYTTTWIKSNSELIESGFKDIVFCSAPSLALAMKWLREVHDIYIMIDKDFVTENGWHYVVVRKQDWANNADNGLIQQESNNYTYEEASEAAIRYCLENLV